MQPWPDQGQNGTDENDTWPTGFMFPPQAGQFDPHQEQWPDQSSFSQIGHDLSDGPAPDFHFDSVHHAGTDAFLGDQNLSDSQSGQPGFHDAGGHDSMAMDQHQPFSAGQDMLDPSFSNLHPNHFAPQNQQQHQGKGTIVDTAIGSSGIGPIAMGQGQNHPAVFAQHDYPFKSQAGSHFDPSPSPSQVPQYTPPLMPRPSPSHQQNHTPVQQKFDGTSNLHTGFSQNQPFTRPPQHQQSHHRHQHQNQQPQSQPPRERTRQHHQQYSTADQPFAPSTNGQPNHFGSHSHLACPQYQENPLHHLQQASFQQPEFISQKTTPFQPPAQGSVGQISPDEQKQQQPRPRQQPQSASLQCASISSQAQLSLPQQLASQVDPKNRQPSNADESPAKRKKSNLKSAPDVAISEPLAGVTTNFLVADSVAKKTEEPLVLKAPLSTAAESKLLGESSKRVKATQSRVPLTKALPFLAYDGTIKLPAPKSYDKLVPLVAVPSRSGKPVVPMLGYDLPCEIQGKFTSQYKPSFDKSGLDDRREEAKIILGEYERSMQALGKRQPKYTEYPHAFKEQLKADEASKNKAEKKAKKELEEERNKPIRAATRPADPAAAAAWDITGIVHIEQSVLRTNALIAGRVQQAGEFLINLRGEVNRAKVALDQATKDKKSDAEITRLRQDADQKKENLYQALDATVEHADDAVLDNLGGHQRLVLSLVNTLIYCIKAGDFSGKLPKIVLELFTHLCMTKKTAETSNFDTVRRRLEDKGDSKVKGFVRDIAVKIKKLTKTSEIDNATGYTGTSAASRAKAGSRSSTAANAPSAKRGRDDDSDATRNVKKIAIEPGSSSLSKKLGQPKSQPQVGSRLTAVAAAKSVMSILPGKPRPVAKPASKSQEAPLTEDSPNASADEKSKADAKRPSAKVETRTATVKRETSTAAPSATSSISSLLESINAKKPEPSVAALAAGSKDGRQSETPETSEQAAKRLRKEARHKLRVSWKPDGELVQIKVFEKGDEEDEGRDMNMIRDAADDRSEGMVLKRRASVAMEDDDEDVPYRPWLAPAATELSNLPEEVRAKNYVTRGGHIVVSTEEQKFMAEREKRELVVLYTDLADIPPTPKSPLAEAEEVGTVGAEQKLGHLPDDEPALKEVHSRWRDEEQMGLEQASLAATKRCQAKSQALTRVDSILGRLHHQAGPGARPNAGRPSPSPSSSPGHSPTASSMSRNTNVSLLLGPAAEEHVLGWLRWDKMNLWRDTKPVGVEPARVHRYTNSEVQAASRMLEAVVASLTNKPYPASSPPDWLARDGDRRVEWWLGYNKEMAAKQKKKEEEDARVGMVASALRLAGQVSGSTQDWGAYYAAQQQQQQQQQQQAYRPYMALLQHMTGLQQQPQQLVPQAPVGGLAQGQQPQILDYQLQSILAAINQPTKQNAFAMPAPSQGPYDGSAQTSSQAGQSPREWEGNENQNKGERKDGRKKSSLPPHKTINKAQAGTKSCTCRQQGKCTRGDKCAFKHK